MVNMAKIAGRIYCLEGLHAYEESGEKRLASEWTMEPMLQLLRTYNLWNYTRRVCATQAEFDYFLDNEWCCCPEGSILYIASHGKCGRIYLSEREFVTLDQLGQRLNSETSSNLKNCYIHICACDVLSIEHSKIKEFMDITDATAISGYIGEVGWAELFPDAKTSQEAIPSIALELLLFATISEQEIDFTSGNNSFHKKLKECRDRINAKFSDCNWFKLVTKLDTYDEKARTYPHLLEKKARSQAVP